MQIWDCIFEHSFRRIFVSIDRKTRLENMCSQLMFAKRGDAREVGTVESRRRNEPASICKNLTYSCMLFFGGEGTSHLISKFAHWQCNCDIASFNIQLGKNCFNWSKEQIGSTQWLPKGNAREQGKVESRSRKNQTCCWIFGHLWNCLFVHSFKKTWFQLIERAEWKACHFNGC